jgi:hypothetical protein
VSENFGNWLKTRAFREMRQKSKRRGKEGEESSALDDCQRVDSVSFGLESDFRKRKNEYCEVAAPV